MARPAKFTVFGANGWLGSATVSAFRQRGHEVRAVTRENWPPSGQDLGHVIYAIGVTTDFHQRPIETADAHVSTLLRVLQTFRLESLLYLSSVRVYRNASRATENAVLSVAPTDADDIYNITKLAGEAVCLALPIPTIRVVRLSWVVGPSATRRHFLASLLDEGRRTGLVTIRRSPDSERDYIALDDAVPLLESIAVGGQQRLYNLASGRNVSNRRLAQLITMHLNIPVAFAPDAPHVAFPPINIDRIRTEFGSATKPFETTFAEVIRGEAK